jgi:hypothetical protein
MPGGCEHYDSEGYEIDNSNAIPTTRLRRWATPDLERIHLGTGDVDSCEGDNGDNPDADQEEEALQADDGSTQSLEA